MKHFQQLIFSFFALLLTAGLAHADPALVRIDDEDTTIYVLGTFHLLPPEAVWRTSAVDAALRETDVIYFEADVWSGGDEAMMGLVQAHGFNTPDAPLSSQMSAEEWQLVSTYSASLGLPPANLEAFRPWFAAVTFGVVAAMAEGYDPNSGVDVQLYTQASAEGRELRFFETADQQIRFFADIPSDVQTEMLVQTADQGKNFAAEIEGLLSAWINGDLERLNEIANLSLQASAPELHEALITNRNQTWAVELNELMDAPGVYFVAVGAGHLPGDEGVIELMRARGFNVVVN